MTDALSTELALVAETRSCRDCKWLWGPEPPYGPFLGFDFDEPLPDSLRKPLPLARQDQAWLRAKTTAPTQIDPAILHGCRKAPIMTLGINPNMTGFFPNPVAAGAAYPRFKHEQSYAYYYRYRRTYQERIAPDAYASWLTPTLRAEKSGTLLAVQRSSSHRWLVLQVRYDDGRDGALQLAWDRAQLLAVAVEVGEHFEAEQTLAGIITPPEGESIELTATGAGYYERFETVLQRFQQRMGWREPLELGEDVSQGDLVACASPGWSKAELDLPQQQLAACCARERGFAVRQFLQSAPAVLVFSGRTALRMFASAVPQFPWLAEWAALPTYELLRVSCESARMLEIRGRTRHFDCRVIVAPHFSYESSYAPGARFTKEAWQDFTLRHAADAALLVASKRVREDDGNFAVTPSDLVLSAPAQEELRARFIDPIDMLSNALADEVQSGRLAREGARLRRAVGNCNFCVNQRWELPGGCAYKAATDGHALLAEDGEELRKQLATVPTKPSPVEAVRLWYGKRKPEIEPAMFATRLRDEFVPATVTAMPPLGLVAYQPALLTELADAPSEIALVAYESRAAYAAAMSTTSGEAYGKQHGTLFDFTDKASRSSFAEVWHGEPLRPDQAYSLFPEWADWQQGRTHITVARLADVDVMQKVIDHLHALRANRRNLHAYLFMITERWWLQWALYQDAAGVIDLRDLPLSDVVFDQPARSWWFPTTPEQPPIQTNEALNVRFARG